MCGADIFLGLLAILFPPLAVWVKTGLCSVDSLINLLLCMLGYIPGLLHAWYIIAKFPEESEYERVSQDAERGGRGGDRVTFVVVHPDQQQQQSGRPQQKQPQPQPKGGMNYGSTSSDNNNNNASSGSAAENGGSSSNNPPPTYSEAVRGDNKIQTQD